MLTITDLHESGECSWCAKTKEVFEAKLPNGAKIKLCLQDLKKTVKMRKIEQTAQPPKQPATP